MILLVREILIIIGNMKSNNGTCYNCLLPVHTEQKEVLTQSNVS